MPRASRFSRGKLELALLEPLPVREAVGEEAIAAAVGDPDDTAVGPETTRRAIRLGERELALLHPLAALAVVGVDRVAGAVRVVSDPQRRAVRPHAGGPVVAAVQLLDVALHGPLEVDLARGGATAAASATASARDDDHRPGGDRDGHLDGRGTATAVVSGDRDDVGVPGAGVEAGLVARAELAGELVDLEGVRIHAAKAVVERVAVHVCADHGRAHGVARLGLLRDGALGRRRRECRGVVYGVDGDRDQGGEAAERPVRGRVHERVRPVVVLGRRVGHQLRGGVRHHPPAARLAGDAHGQGVAVVLVGVVPEDVEGNGRILLGRHRWVGDRHGRFVDVLNGDVERGRSRGVVFVLRRHRDAVPVMVLVLVIECGAAGDLDLP